MTDAPLSVITSPDGSSWSKPQNLVNGYSDYGLQMHVYRGELYGIMTQTVQYPRQMFATKFKIETGWKAWRSLPENWLAQGRVSVTVLEDRFFVLRRGTNDAAYLCWTDDFETWVDVGRVGSVYAKTMVAPAICAHDGKLYMTGVGPDKYIYYTVADKDGKRLNSWTKIPGTGTQSALAMCVYNARLWLFHTGYNSDKFFYQYLNDDGVTWSKLASVDGSVTSGLSATSWKYNTLVVTFRGKDQDIKWNQFDGTKWLGKKYIPNVYMKYQTGLATWGGRLVVSYAANKRYNSKFLSYLPSSMAMSEKNAVFDSAKEVEEWDCKWNQDKDEDKSWVKKIFCL